MLELERAVASSTLSIQTEFRKDQVRFDNPLGIVQTQWSCLVGVGRVGLLTSTTVVQESVAGSLGLGDDLNVYGVACMDGKVWQLLLR